MERHERLYRCLLLVLPSRLRREAQDELIDTFAQEYQRVMARGPVARTTFWARMAADLVVTAAAEHLDRRRHHSARDSHDPARSRMTQLRQLLAHIVTDASLAARRFAKMPGWTIASAGTLALGLAASIVTGVLVRDLLW